MSPRAPTPHAPLPWYRHRWPWFLMSGPAIVVVAGTFTAALAVRTSDGLVADDYYKLGLMVDRVIAREDRAAQLGVSATLRYDAGALRADVECRTPERGKRCLAPVLLLRIVHPTRAGEDRLVMLKAARAGAYEGALAGPPDTARRIVLEDEHTGWRIAGTWGARSPWAKMEARPPGG